MATQNAINIGDSARCFTGVATWGGTGNYFDDTTLGSFTVLRAGTGFARGKPVSWAGNQTITGLTAANCYFICMDSTGTIYKTTDEDTAYSGDYVPLFECLRDSSSPTNVQLTVKEDHPYTVPFDVNHYLHDSIGTIIENRNNGANLSINATISKMDIVGSDALLDHGLETAISAASPVTWHKMHTNPSNWVHQATVTNPGDTFGGYWNNAGTATALTGAANNKFCVYTFYVSKDNKNSASPIYIAVLGLAKYDKQADAATAISTGTNIGFASGELLTLELCRLGYGIYGYAAGGFVQVVISKATFQQASSTSGTNTASLITTTTTNFDGMLSASNTNVQSALETINDFPKALSAQADPGSGTVSKTTLTNVVNSSLSTGAMTILSTTTNPGNSAGYIKMYVGTTVVYVPYFTNIAP